MKTKIHILTVTSAAAFVAAPILSAQVPEGWQRSQSLSPVASSAPAVLDVQPAGKGQRFVPDELLVGFRQGAGAAERDEAQNAVRGKKLKAFEKINVQHWKLPAGLSVERAIEILSANPNVKFAEPNYTVRANDFALPNDPLRAELWGMHNLGQSNSTADADIDALEAWQVPPGFGNVVVGVIDTGIDFTHPDLAGKKWINPGEIPGNGVDDDLNGYVDDVHGWDFVAGDNDPSDDNSHGTHVAGTIAAGGNDGTGVIGVAGLNPKVQLIALKFLDADGGGTTDAAISAVLYAASLKDENGQPAVRITNNSWGGDASSEAMKAAIEASNSLFVAAAGNDSMNFPFYPAGYVLPNVLAVAATNSRDSLAWFSNYGSWVHIAAPGEAILSTTPDGNYERYDGTSMASPHVAGSAALVLSQVPGLDPNALKRVLLDSADVVTALSGKTLRGTRLNIARALGLAPDQDEDIISPAAVSGLVADQPTQTSARLSWTVPVEAANGYLSDVRYLINRPVTESNWNSALQLEREPAPVAGSTAVVSVGELAPGTDYYFGVKLVNRSGIASPLAASSEPVRTQNLGWRPSLVDSVGDALGYRSSSSLAFNAAGIPVLAYSDYASSRMKVATQNGTGWLYETLGNDFGAPSLALNADKPNLAWSNGSVLYFSTKASGKWASATVDRGNIFRYSAPSLAFSGGSPAISYRLHGSTGGLKYATRSGTTWKTLRIDAGPIGPDTSLAFNPATGQPVIAYARYVNGNPEVNSLAIVQFDGTRWAGGQLDGQYGIAGEVTSCSLAFDSAGNPVIANCGNGVLRIHRFVGSAVYYATFDRAISCDLFMQADHCWIAYDDGNGKRKVLNGSLAVSPSTWTSEVADLDGSGSGKPSIRPGAGGTPHLSSFVGRDLRLAKRDESYRGPSYPFQDDMESGLGSWTVEGDKKSSLAKTTPAGPDGTDDGSLWHQTARRGEDGGHSPMTSWYYGSEITGTYDTGTRNWGRLISPEIALGTATERGTRAELTVSQVVLAEGARQENGEIQVRIVGSNTWSTIFQRASRTSGAFITDTLDLTPYLGKTIQIGFFFDTKDGSYNQYEGWYVDDVRLKWWP